MQNNYERQYQRGMEELENVFSNSPNPKATKNIMIGVVIFIMMFPFIPIIISLIANSGGSGDSGRYVKEEAIVSWTESTMENGEFVNIMYVNYFGGDQFYERARLDKYIADAKVGDTVDIYYDKNNPEKIYTTKPQEEGSGNSGFGIHYVSMLIFAIPMVIAGIFVIKKMINGGEAKKKLIDTGIRIDATVENILLHSANPNTGAARYYIYCMYQDPSNGVIHRFKSERIEGVDPAIYNPVGSNIPVYVKPNNYKEYYVYSQATNGAYAQGMNGMNGAYAQGMNGMNGAYAQGMNGMNGAYAQEMNGINGAYTQEMDKTNDTYSETVSNVVDYTEER